MNKAKRIIIGFPITLISIGLLAGFENVVMFLFFAVICTGGVGGLVLLLISYIIGSIIDLFILSRYEKRRLAAFEEKLTGESPEVQAVVRYIIDARKHKMSDETVRKILRNNGWQNSVIDRAEELIG